MLARNRNINAVLLDDFIQTDVPINRGNFRCVGPAVRDMTVVVIGVNSAIFSPTICRSAFAFPSSNWSRIQHQLFCRISSDCVRPGAGRRNWSL